MRKIHTALLYRQVAKCASAWRAKDALCFGATRLCDGARDLNCEIRMKSPRSVQNLCTRAFPQKTEVEPRFSRRPHPSSVALSYTARTGRIIAP